MMRRLFNFEQHDLLTPVAACRRRDVGGLENTSAAARRAPSQEQQWRDARGFSFRQKVTAALAGPRLLRSEIASSARPGEA
jgi:hypothetical protein